MSDTPLTAETHTWTPDAQGAIDGPEPLTSKQSFSDASVHRCTAVSEEYLHETETCVCHAVRSRR